METKTKFIERIFVYTNDIYIITYVFKHATVNILYLECSLTQKTSLLNLKFSQLVTILQIITSLNRTTSPNRTKISFPIVSSYRGFTVSKGTYNKLYLL